MLAPMQDRIHIRLTTSAKRAIRKAAKMDGRTLSSFVLRAALDRALIITASTKGAK